MEELCGADGGDAPDLKELLFLGTRNVTSASKRVLAGVALLRIVEGLAVYRGRQFAPMGEGGFVGWG